MRGLLTRRLGCALAAAIAAAGCAAPGTPLGPSGAAPAADLTGTWTGRRVVEWHPIDGGGSCRQDVTATFTQTAGTVVGTIADTPVGDCGLSTFRFSGEMRGTLVLLNLALRDTVSPATGLLAEGRLIVSWFNVTWVLTHG